MALNYRGYIYASIAGNYTFTMAQPDDRVLLWLGPFAITGWTAANAKINLWFASTTGFSTTYSVPTAGTYIPIRVVGANNGAQTGDEGPQTWSMTVTNPYGGYYEVGTSALPAPPNLVRYSCDSVAAPMYSYSIGSEL